MRVMGVRREAPSSRPFPAEQREGAVGGGARSALQRLRQGWVQSTGAPASRSKAKASNESAGGARTEGTSRGARLEKATGAGDRRSSTVRPWPPLKGLQKPPEEREARLSRPGAAAGLHRAELGPGERTGP